GRGRAQVLVEGARGQRRLVNEEAEPQVMKSQAAKMLGQGPARAQPRADLRDHLRADLVVADEGHVAVPFAARLRLGDVMEKGAQAERGAAGELVGRRLGAQL